MFLTKNKSIRLAFGFSLFILAMLAADKAGAANRDNGLNLKPVDAYFSGDPICVNPDQHAKFPLVLKNTSNQLQTLTVVLTYVVPAGTGDPNGTVITTGTSHLLGRPGYLHWSVSLRPGQTATRNLVTVVNEPNGKMKGPGRYGVTVLVYSDKVPSLEIAVSSTPTYCF